MGWALRPFAQIKYTVQFNKIPISVLELHRASAGSGKTYTLAKKYLWYFLTISEEGAPRRLRTNPELSDSARHILAVTFTNKATNEMQMRIVERLYDLASIPPVFKKDKNGKSIISSPDYMQEFSETLRESPQRIAAAARKGLSFLLENYSDFKVSTIDSFFQLVLRTFAYESELNDSYQVELDNDYLSKIGVDGTLEEIDSPRSGDTSAFWISALMDRSQSAWNIFSRDADSDGSSPYKDFIESLKKLENEEFKKIRDDLTAYFKRTDPADLVRLYSELKEQYGSRANQSFDSARKGAQNFISALPEKWRGGTTGKRPLNTVVSTLLKIARLQEIPDDGGESLNIENINPDFWLTEDLQSHIDSFPEAASAFAREFPEALKAIEEWQNDWKDTEMANWRLYEVNLPYLALMERALEKRRDFLNENNAVELGETAVILNSIIGENDTPFVYERLGTYLNHFLIDEFQDTSELQWLNMGPLVKESLSRGNENLIIGDAKQSIYRFRNADPSLISEKVPAEFAGRISLLGNRISENTNWRSQLHIVQFNNSLFDFIASRLGEEGKRTANSGGYVPKDFKELYSNVVQYPNKQAAAGYVEIIQEIPDEGGSKPKGSKKASWSQKIRGYVPRLVDSLIKRGYAQREIAVLVSTNAQGSAVIGEFVEWNENRDTSSGNEIRFVSEQSLLVASALSVQLVTGVLESIARGLDIKLNEGESARLKGVGSWDEMKTDFRFYAAMHAGQLPTEELLEEFIASRPGSEDIVTMLEELPSLGLPAIVEAVCARFIKNEAREKDALYLAAFQDLVLEYCENHPTDMRSFLDWWERKSKKASISSPEDTDAVQVMTIHKSKGLEFDCVIVPYADWDFDDHVKDNRREWRWVKPELVSHPEIEMPVFLPVFTSDDMALTSHSDLLKEFYDEVRMDRLNTAYVAFTRASRELYIIAPSATKKAMEDYAEAKANLLPARGFMPVLLREFVSHTQNASEPPTIESLSADILSIEDGDDQLRHVKIGAKTEDIAEFKAAKRAQVSKENPSGAPVKRVCVLEDYPARIPDAGALRVRLGELPEVVEIEPEDAEATDDERVPEIAVERLDPRSEGNLKHAVLQYVRTPADLSDAVRRVRLAGYLDEETSMEIETSLSKALEHPMASRWFAKGLKIINERSILKSGMITRRPDRIVVDPSSGRAEVVDYKFGHIDTTGRYRRQIGNYVKLLRQTGHFSSVSGYIWYVNAGKIELV